jgi:hypothetical protein
MLPKMTIWEDDLPEEVMERLAGVLCEIGVIIRPVEKGMDGDYVTHTFSFELAEPLPEAELI